MIPTIKVSHCPRSRSSMRSAGPVSTPSSTPWTLPKTPMKYNSRLWISRLFISLVTFGDAITLGNLGIETGTNRDPWPGHQSLGNSVKARQGAFPWMPSLRQPIYRAWPSISVVHRKFEVWKHFSQEHVKCICFVYGCGWIQKTTFLQK